MSERLKRSRSDASLVNAQTDAVISLWKEIRTEYGKLDKIQSEHEHLMASFDQYFNDPTVYSIKDIDPIKKMYQDGLKQSEKLQMQLSNLLECVTRMVSLRDILPEVLKKEDPSTPTKIVTTAKDQMENIPSKYVSKVDSPRLASPIKKVKIDLEHPTLSVFKGKGNFPPLCGAIPSAENYVVPVGELVAAKISKPKAKTDDWILATVINSAPDKHKYEVQDIEDEDSDEHIKNISTGPKHYALIAKNIIPLPNIIPDPPKKECEFSAGESVLALYPGTTCFYKATVAVPPIKRRRENDYLVMFEDDDDNEGFLPQRRVSQRFVISPLATLKK